MKSKSATKYIILKKDFSMSGNIE